MSRDATAHALARALRQPPEALRRADRAAPDERAAHLLRTAAVGTLATVHDGQPFLNTNLFAWEPEPAPHGTLWMHTAHVGRTAANVDAAPPAPVCFSVFTMGRLLPDDRALEFSVEYAGVVAFGTGRLARDAADARHGLALLMEKYAPHLRPDVDYEPPTPADLARTAVFRVDVERVSAKEKTAPEDFPGAYRYEDVARDAR